MGWVLRLGTACNTIKRLPRTTPASPDHSAEESGIIQDHREQGVCTSHGRLPTIPGGTGEEQDTTMCARTTTSKSCNQSRFTCRYRRQVSYANASRNQPGSSNAPQMYSPTTESTINKPQSSVPAVDVKSSEVTAAQTYEQLISMLISQMEHLKPLFSVQKNNAKKLVVTMIRLIWELLMDLETLI